MLTTGGTFNEYRGSSGWLPSAVDGAGSVLTMSAGRGDRVSVVTADHSVFEYSGHSGWLQRTAAGFARDVHAAGRGARDMAVYAVTLDGALYRHDDGIGWSKFGDAGTIGAVSAGSDATGNADAFVLTPDGAFYELSEATGWKRLSDPGAARPSRTSRLPRMRMACRTTTGTAWCPTRPGGSPRQSLSGP